MKILGMYSGMWQEEPLYFEQILSGMQNQGGGQNVTVNNVIEARAFKRTRKLLMKIFPQGSGIRRTLGKMYWRILDK